MNKNISKRIKEKYKFLNHALKSWVILLFPVFNNQRTKVIKYFALINKSVEEMEANIRNSINRLAKKYTPE